LSEDDRVEDCAEPYWKEAKYALDFLNLSDGAEAPRISDGWLFMEGQVIIIWVDECGSVQEPCK